MELPQPAHRPLIALFASGVLATALVGCVGVVEGTGGAGRGETQSGITLTPPEGIGRRALECEPDVAPLRRLTHAEYKRTLEDLFEGSTLPTIQVAPDARRAGFTNNFESLAPSSLLVNQYYENAVAIASAVTPGVVSSLSCARDLACFRSFVTTFGERAYRRPLTTNEVNAYVSIFQSGPVANDFPLSVEIAILTFLQTADFLYRPEFGGGDDHLTQYEIASRLSYFIWGTMPDDALLDAAGEGRLSGASLEAEVDRMLSDERARDGLIAATTEWLGVDGLATRLKAESYNFTPEVRSALRTSLEMFLWERVFAQGGSIDALLTSNGAYVNSTVGRFFGVTDAGPDWQWRELPNRSGILTHPALLAIHGYGTYPSPVKRGVFVLTELLCDPPSPPPPGIPMGEPPTQGHDGQALTNRQGYEVLTQSLPNCAFCHKRINPFGFAFENFDTVGAYRETDNGLPVNASGSSSGFTLGAPFQFEDARELTQQMNEGTRVRACIVDRWVRYASGGGSLAYDPCVREELEAITARPGASLRDLVLGIALHPKFVSAEVVQ